MLRRFPHGAPHPENSVSRFAPPIFIPITMKLIKLSTELLESMASFLPQVGLLSVSLTCKRLRTATELELFREYLCPGGDNPIAALIKRLLGQPDLAKYVQKICLKDWVTLGHLDPEKARGEYGNGYYGLLFPPNKSEYALFAEAAQAAGIITAILPYETESWIFERLMSDQFVRIGY
ncbi:hypothetical protein K458DRAFT_42686 [Lentithecium fluviatile CBS 122367]|uniref:F-box domain-containing protein n=1 Tax=Lentithecium fluviatile CBS 122367 TaxID=1168545 RepID=A0A6G1IZX2_9PLEO|nr:hypothetical protein K458DRAFT_42686 [Lentithecium fluviatile CBS 122367]